MLLVLGVFTDWLHHDERVAPTHIFLNYAHKAKDCNPFSYVVASLAEPHSRGVGRVNPIGPGVSACYKQVDHPYGCSIAALQLYRNAGKEERKARAET